jgi:hypothetical protein
MKELELLKADWNKEHDYKNYSERDIHDMIRQKSVSVAKTLFMIGIAEIILWSLIGYIDAEVPVIRMILFTAFIIPVILLYRNIKTSENSVSLMKNIFNLRKIIFTYAFISFLMIVIDNIIHFDRYTRDLISGWNIGRAQNNHKISISDPEILIPSTGNYIAFGLVLIIVVWLVYLVYKSTYGKVLTDLKKNYKELSRSEEKLI